MAAVQYVEASRLYPGNPVPAVNHLNLDVADGEFVVLVGPSGSGKSTPLRMLAAPEDVAPGESRTGAGRRGDALGWQAEGAVRWPAPACRHGPCDRRGAQGLPNGGAAFQPR